MNLEIILAFIVGALIGGFATFKLLPGFLKSIFRDTARDELSEIQEEINDDQKQNEDCLLYTSPSPRDVEESPLP